MVLVVDDNPDIVKALRTILERTGYRVETAADGVAAYEKLKMPDCKCMLLDVNMPKINGIELLLLMQAEDIEVPVILMAGFKDFDDEEMKQFPNVRAFLAKPFSLGDMLNAITTHAPK